MSRAEARGASRAGPRAVAGPRPAVALRAAAQRGSALVFRRWRTLALLGVLAAVPVLVGIAVRIETAGRLGRRGGGTAVHRGQVTNNGLFLVFTSLAVDPAVLPAHGDRRGRRGRGRRRGRRRDAALPAGGPGRAHPAAARRSTLSVLVFCVAATLVVAVAALAVGAALFPFGEVTLISGHDGRAVARGCCGRC